MLDAVIGCDVTSMDLVLGLALIGAGILVGWVARARS
jgi:hypothetical protein